MPDVRLYRLSWLIAIALAALSLLALRSPGLLALSDQPVSFSGDRALQSLREVVRRFPGRTAGSSADRRAARWLAGQLQALALSPQVEPFSATIGGKRVELHNVWAVSKGTAAGAIVVVAHMDSPPLSTQGADDNASGIAAVLELAQVFTATVHTHPIVFLFTDGDSYGALGASEFVHRHTEIAMTAVLCLSQVAGRGAHVVYFNGWSATPRVAPPWLWALGRTAARAETSLRAPLPSAISQLLRLAVPCATGSQAPFVSAGIPAIAVSAPTRGTVPPADTIDKIAVETLAMTGRTAERMITTVDGAPQPSAPSGQTIFISMYRKLGGGWVTWALIVLQLPVAVLTADLVRRERRGRLSFGGARAALIRLGLRLAPWYLALLVVYVANFFSLLPHSPGAIIPPGSAVSQNPRYLRAILLLLFLVVAYNYAMAIEHRLARRLPASQEAVVLVALGTLLVIACLVAIINPFSLLLLLPASALWPLARPGQWTRSLLPAWGGLAALVAAFAFFGLRLHLGWATWWYFFLLIENRTVPVPAVMLVIAFVATTAFLGHELHREPDVATAGAGSGDESRDRDSRHGRRGRAREGRERKAASSSAPVLPTGDDLTGVADPAARRPGTTGVRRRDSRSRRTT